MTSWSRALLEKLIDAKVVKEFSVLCMARRFNGKFKLACHWTLF
jgi:hypothetical protein